VGAARQAPITGARPIEPLPPCRRWRADIPPSSGREKGRPVFENQENATKISATTATSTVRVMKVSMAAVPNEA
jgi:hypothetical protein